MSSLLCHSLSLSAAQTHTQTTTHRHPSLQGQQDKLVGGEQLPSLPVNDNYPLCNTESETQADSLALSLPLSLFLVLTPKVSVFHLCGLFFTQLSILCSLFALSNSTSISFYNKPLITPLWEYSSSNNLPLERWTVWLQCVCSTVALCKNQIEQNYTKSKEAKFTFFCDASVSVSGTFLAQKMAKNSRKRSQLLST